MSSPKLSTHQSGYGGRGYADIFGLNGGKVMMSITTAHGILDKPGIRNWERQQIAAFAVTHVDQIASKDEEVAYRYLMAVPKFLTPESLVLQSLTFPAMLDSEVNRHHGIPGLPALYGTNPRYVDPAIFSRVFDKYVKGGHQLITVAKRNGIEIEEDRLHAADYDVEVTEKLVKAMLNRAWRELSDLREGCTPDEFVTRLQAWQKEQKALWADHLTAYFAEQGKTEENGSKIIVNGAFPY